MLIHQFFESNAQSIPDKIAVICGEDKIDYALLHQRADRLAKCLSERGVAQGSIVGIFMERSIDLIVALLAIWKAGAAFLPIDILYPKSRVQYLLQNSGAKLLLSQENLREKLDEIIPKDSILLINDQCYAKQSISPPKDKYNAENLAYIIYTSGSTGHPKGVMLTHKNIASLYEGLQKEITLSSHDVVLAITSISFDVSIPEVLLPLAYGGTIVLAKDSERSDPHALLNLMHNHQITLVQATPTFLSHFLRYPGVLECLKKIKSLIVTGEMFPPSLLNSLEEVKKTAIYNMYGPTEATIWCTIKKLTDKITLGKPLSNADIYILDKAQKSVPNGTPGEICIGGAGVARGYLNDSDLTQKKFIHCPPLQESRIYKTGDKGVILPNGDLQYLGRMDTQVKIRGLRVELEEIEHHLASLEGVERAVVVEKEQQLYGHVMTKVDEPRILPQIKTQLEKLLPKHMIPKYFHLHKTLPLAENGKVDRAALLQKSIESSCTDREVNSQLDLTEPQRELCHIWSELLHVSTIGLHDNFFHLGGDSLMAIQMAIAFRNKGFVIPTSTIYQKPTISELSEIALPCEAGELTDSKDIPENSLPLMPAQQFLLDTIDNYNFWGVPVLFTFDKGRIDADLLNKALVLLLRYHDTFHYLFEKKGEVWAQRLQRKRIEISEDFLQRVDFSPLPDDQLSRSIGNYSTDTHKSLNITEGPTAKAVLYECGERRPQHLLLSIHHLICDGVSLITLRDHLEMIYTQLLQNQRVKLPAKTASLREWIHEFDKLALSAPIEKQFDYWKKQLQPVASLPFDYPAKKVGIEDQIQVKISKEVTEELAAIVRKNKLSFRSLLLALFAQVLTEWTGASVLNLFLTGHGRENLIAFDVSQTIGPFLSLYPLKIDLGKEKSLRESCHRVNEYIADIPNNGFGYGLLRYFGRGTIRHQLQELGLPEVAFNFVGIIGGGEKERLFHYAVGEEMGRERDQHSFPLRLASIILDGRLDFMWSYSINHFKQDTIEKLIDSYREKLTQVISCYT